MAEPRWNRAKQVFHEALETSGPARARLVAAACGDDAELRAQVEGLLAAHDEAGVFLASPTGAGADAVARAATTLAADLPPEAPGTRIGPYKLLQVIGEGGFGVVYMAEQEHPIQRRVALKIIKLGMDTQEVIARFEAERQALAMMDHPNIAKVFDAGATDSGRPYFVMELVKGVPITDYCDANQLSTRERLDLFADVCKGIHHAHEKGVIHRDIKPTNVMVTLHDGTPVPKIIDFGIAKATHQRLTEKTLFTAYGAFVGTPAYMSPEQTELSGLEIDRRSDVYALGVLLYELLTGTTPFEVESLRARAFLEVMRIIREEDPPTPSARVHTLGSRRIEVASRRQIEPDALEKLIRGDLDWIVMKALDKDRRRRYGSASELVDDLGRYFRDEPVTARRPSAGYRLGKFAKRRRGTIAVAASVVGAVALGGFAATVGSIGSGEPGPPTTRQVLDLMGPRDTTVPSQDGLHQLRYSAERRGYEVVDIASGETKRLINVAPDFQRITWAGRSIAPDGRLLVTGAPRRAPHPDSAVAALRLFSVGGAEDGRVLRQWPADVRWVEELAWSPAQTHVWVLVNREKTIDIASVAIEDGSILTAKTLASRGPGSVSASLSPDGRFLAYHHSDGAASPRDLFLVSGDGSREVRLEHPANDSNPLFTPDGSGIVFQSDREGGAVWFLPIVDGRPAGAARAVWDDLGLGGQLMQFAENGSLLYKSGGNRWEIYAADIDLERGTVGPPQLIPPLGAEINNAPAFSPDGRVLAHLRNMGRRLVLRDLASGGEREFPIAGPLVAPVIDFCPSGQSVVVTGYEYPGPNTAAVYRVDLQRGGAARLRVAIEPFTAAACVGNGREVVYVTPREHPEAVSEVVRQSLDTGAVTTLHDAARVGVIRSNDGRMIGFTARVNNKEQLVVMPTSGGKAVPLGVSATNQEGAMWLPDTGGLLFVRPSDGTDPRSPSLEETFMRLPLDGGAPAEVGRVTLPPFQNARLGSRHWRLNPTASRIVFERHAGTVNQVWAIDNLLSFIQSGRPAMARPVRR